MPREFENLAKEISSSSKDVSNQLVDMAAAAELADKAISSLTDAEANAAKVAKIFTRALSKMDSAEKKGAREKKAKTAATKKANAEAKEAAKVEKVAADAAKKAADADAKAKKKLEKSVKSLRDEMAELDTVASALVKTFKEGENEAKSFARGIGASGGALVGAGVATVYLANKVGNLVDTYKDAAKSLATFNVMAAKSGKTIRGIDAAGLAKVRNELSLSKSEATEFYSVLQEGADSGVVSVGQLVHVAEKLQKAFGGDPTKKTAEFFELIKSIPTLVADLSVTASVDDKAASLFALAKAGKITTYLELKQAGAFEGDVTVASAEDVKLLNAAHSSEKIQEDIKDFLVSKLFPAVGPRLGVISHTMNGVFKGVGGIITVLGAMKIFMASSSTSQLAAQERTTQAVLTSAGRGAAGGPVVTGGGGKKAKKGFGAKGALIAIAATFALGLLGKGADKLSGKLEKSGNESGASAAKFGGKLLKAGATIGSAAVTGAFIASAIPIPVLSTAVGALIGSLYGAGKAIWDWVTQSRAERKEAAAKKEEAANAPLSDADKALQAYGATIQKTDSLFGTSKALLSNMNREIASMELHKLSDFGSTAEGYTKAVETATKTAKKKFKTITGDLETQRAEVVENKAGLAPDRKAEALANIDDKILQSFQTMVEETMSTIEKIPNTAEVLGGLDFGAALMEFASLSEDAGAFAEKSVAVTAKALKRRAELQQVAIDEWEKLQNTAINKQAKGAFDKAKSGGATDAEAKQAASQLRMEMEKTKNTQLQAKIQHKITDEMSGRLESIENATKEQMRGVDIQKEAAETGRELAEAFSGSAREVAGFLHEGLALEKQTLAILQKKALEARQVGGNSVKVRQMELEVIKQGAKVRKTELEDVKKITELRLMEVASAEQGLEDELDYLNYVGGHYSKMLDIQGDMVKLAREKYNIEQEALEELKAKGITGRQLLDQENKVRKTWFDMQKKSLGVQKDVMEKILGSAIGSIRGDFGARKGRNRLSSKVGIGKSRVFNAAGINQAAGPGGVQTIAQRSIMRQLKGADGGGPSRLEVEERIAKAGEDTSDATVNMNKLASTSGSLFTHDEGVHGYLKGILGALKGIANGGGSAMDGAGGAHAAVALASSASAQVAETAQVAASSIGLLGQKSEQAATSSSKQTTMEQRHAEYRKKTFGGGLGTSLSGSSGRSRLGAKLGGLGTKLGKPSGTIGLGGRGSSSGRRKIKTIGGSEQVLLQRRSFGGPAAAAAAATTRGAVGGTSVTMGDEEAASNAWNRALGEGVAAQNAAGQQAWEASGGHGTWGGARAASLASKGASRSGAVPGSPAVSHADKPGVATVNAPAGGSSSGGGASVTMRIEGTLKVDFGSMGSTMATMVASVINTAEVSKALDQSGRRKNNE